jgi:hypothetical protein
MAAPENRNGIEYAWWERGAADEALTRRDGLSRDGVEAVELLDSLAKLNPSLTGAGLALLMAQLYCPGKLKRRHRQ